MSEFEEPGISGALSTVNLGLLVGIALLIIIILIISRLLKSSRGEKLSTGGGLNLIELKQKGLLTPAEMEKVSNSIMRQMTLREDRDRKKSLVPTSETLLLDPEVRRLEVIAAAGQKATTSAGKPIRDQKAELPVETEQSKTEDHLEDVELPLDIVQLFDAGLLTDEELVNIKRRIAARRDQP